MDDFVYVVEDDDAVVEGEVEIGEVAVVSRGAGRREFVGLGVADGVVAGEADPAAEEAVREAGLGGLDEAQVLDHAAGDVERVGLAGGFGGAG